VAKALIDRKGEEWSPLNTARIAAAELTVSRLKEIEKRLSLRIAEIKQLIEKQLQSTLSSRREPRLHEPCAAQELAGGAGSPDRDRRTSQARRELGKHPQPV
jgi:hypothetical protein